jgi:hypothetical protein
MRSEIFVFTREMGMMFKRVLTARAAGARASSTNVHRPHGEWAGSGHNNGDRQ